jgi:hypothetical protein
MDSVKGFPVKSDFGGAEVKFYKGEFKGAQTLACGVKGCEATLISFLDFTSAVIKARSLGWRRTNVHGWTCPQCSKKLSLDKRRDPEKPIREGW